MTMKEENEITEEVRELLDSLEQHGANARRQKELSDLIDSLAAGTSLRAKHRRLYPIWWIVGAAAACLLLWLLARPTFKETPNMNEEILVEEIGVKDTIQKENETIEESVILEEPVPKKLLAEETPIKTKKTQNQSTIIKPTPKAVEENFVEPQLVENTAIESTKPEPTDTSNIGSNPIPNVVEEPIAVQSPHRRVIRSLNLVCYECQKEPEYVPQAMIEDRTIFGQLQDPNMKNGSWAFEVKLY